MKKTVLWLMICAVSLAVSTSACEEEPDPQSTRDQDNETYSERFNPIPMYTLPQVIDVLIVYTEKSLEEASAPHRVDRDHMKRFIASQVWETNEIYRKLGFELRVVHTELLDFAGEEDPRWGENSSGRKALFDWFKQDAYIKDLKDAYGADLVGLIYERTEKHAKRWNWGCGMASVGNSMWFGYFMIPRVCDISNLGCRSNKIVGYQMAHEIGHNLGLWDHGEVDEETNTRTIMSDPDGDIKCSFRRIGEFRGNQWEAGAVCKVWEDDVNEEFCLRKKANSWATHPKNTATKIICRNLYFRNRVGNRYCNMDASPIQGSNGKPLMDPNGKPILIEYNSDVCDWDGGDCCRSTCGDRHCGGPGCECIDPTQ